MSMTTFRGFVKNKDTSKDKIRCNWSSLVPHDKCVIWRYLKDPFWDLMISHGYPPWLDFKRLCSLHPSHHRRHWHFCLTLRCPHGRCARQFQGHGRRYAQLARAGGNLSFKAIKTGKLAIDHASTDLVAPKMMEKRPPEYDEFWWSSIVESYPIFGLTPSSWWTCLNYVQSWESTKNGVRCMCLIPLRSKNRHRKLWKAAVIVTRSEWQIPWEPWSRALIDARESPHAPKSREGPVNW